MWEQIHIKEIGPFITTISVWDLNNRYVRIEHLMGSEVVAQNFLCTLTLKIHRSFDELREACQRYANEASDEERDIGMISEEERQNARDQQEEDAPDMPELAGTRPEASHPGSLVASEAGSEERQNSRDQQEEDALGMPGDGSDSEKSIRTIPSPRYLGSSRR